MNRFRAARIRSKLFPNMQVRSCRSERADLSQGPKHSRCLLRQGLGGLARDTIQAYTWEAPAAASGHRPAAGRRYALAARMPPERLAEAQKIVRNWKPTTPPAGVPDILHPRLQPVRMPHPLFLFSDLLFSPDVNYSPRSSVSFEPILMAGANPLPDAPIGNREVGEADHDHRK